MATHVLAIALGIALVAVDTAARVFDWHNGAAQCQLAAQRCVGLRARVLTELASWPSDDSTAAARELEHARACECLGLVIEEMQLIHASEASRFLGKHRLVLPLGASPDR